MRTMYSFRWIRTRTDWRPGLLVGKTEEGRPVYQVFGVESFLHPADDDIGPHIPNPELCRLCRDRAAIGKIVVDGMRFDGLVCGVCRQPVVDMIVNAMAQHGAGNAPPPAAVETTDEPADVSER